MSYATRSAPLVLLLVAACQTYDVLPIDDPLPRPAALASTSLDGAVALSWSDEPFQSAPQRFRAYRVYSTTYDLDADRCGASWAVEGSTVAPEFIVGALTNGRSRCFAVSAQATDGSESARSPARFDTPRYQANGAALFARQVEPTQSSFRFWRDIDGDGRAVRSELGRVGSASATDADFVIERDPTGSLFFTPTRPGTRIAVWGDAPISNISQIDLAPALGYTTGGVEALGGWGYVVEMSGLDGYKRFGAIRVVTVGQGLVVFDWSFQSDPGNPELLRID